MGYQKKEIKARTPEKALDILRWMCSKGEKTRQDCVKSLFRWMVPQEEHQKIIDTLLEEKFVDETRYAKMYINEKHNFYKWGRTKIVYSLRLKGIDKEVIDEICNEIISVNPDREILQGQIEKKAKKFEPIPISEKYKTKMKLMHWAYSRGFTIDDINYCLEKYFRGDQD